MPQHAFNIELLPVSRWLLGVLAVVICSVVQASDQQLGYFGQHMIIAPGSPAAQAVSKDYPSRPKRRSPPVVTLGNVAIALPTATATAVPGDPSQCGQQSNDSLTICVGDHGLPVAQRLAALAFMSEPTLVLVPNPDARAVLVAMLVSDPDRRAHTEIKELDDSVCTDACRSRKEIQLIRKGTWQN